MIKKNSKHVGQIQNSQKLSISKLFHRCCIRACLKYSVYSYENEDEKQEIFFLEIWKNKSLILLTSQ